MQITKTSIPECLLLEPHVFSDERGFFLESWNASTFAAAGLNLQFVQDNHSCSQQGVLRGLHYQIVAPQGKLVRVTRGSVFDVAVDLRRSSESFGRWVGVELTEQNHRMFWVPPGFAHGFLVTSESADFQYKCTTPYASEHDRSLKWDDPAIGIDWPLVSNQSPHLSEKDAAAPLLCDAECFQ